MTHRTLLMIRPERPAHDFVRALERAIGHVVKVIYSPLIGIVPLSNNLNIQGVTHLLFTSVNGVEQFVAQNKERNIPAICVGRTTSAAAISHGLRAQSADGTVQQLLALVCDICAPENSKLLYIRGENISFDLISALQAEDFTVSQAILYQQTDRQMQMNAIELLLNHPVVIPVFSANGARMLQQELVKTMAFDVLILCISRSVSDHFTGCNTVIAQTPDRAGMINCLRQLT